MTMTPETLAELERLMKAMSPGEKWNLFTNRHPETSGAPWGCIEAHPHPAGGAGAYPSGMTITWTGTVGRANAALTVSLHNAAPALLASAADGLRARAVVDKELAWIDQLADEASRAGNPVADARALAMRDAANMIRTALAAYRKEQP